MGWTSKYWDMLNQLYWSPGYLGFKSIPQRLWRSDGDSVTIDKSLTNPDGPLYRRVTTAKTFPTMARRQEELFNHIFDFTFAILDGRLTSTLFCRMTGSDMLDELTSLGRDFGDQLGHPGLYDICQPDGLFVGDAWNVAVELKFGAPTSLDQLGKYLLAFAVERHHRGTAKPCAILYISPNPEKLVESAFPFNTNALGPQCLDEILPNTKLSARSVLAEYKESALEVLQDLTICSVHWSVLGAELLRFAAERNSDEPSNSTTYNLLMGLAEEIAAHPMSGWEGARAKC